MGKRGGLLIGLVVCLCLMVVSVAAAEEPEIPYNGYQWGYPFEVASGWAPMWVEPIPDFHWGEYLGPDRGWDCWFSSLAQPVYMGRAVGSGFQDIEFLGYQDQRMWIQDFEIHMVDGKPVVVVSPKMPDHGGRVQFVFVTDYGFTGDRQVDWIPSPPPPPELILNWQP